MKFPEPLPNKLVDAALREQQRFALTASEWEIVREFIRGAEPLCLRTHPLVRQVIYRAWQLVRFQLRDARVSGTYGHTKFHISMALILIGLLGGTLCGCSYCSRENFEDGEWKLD